MITDVVLAICTLFLLAVCLTNDKGPKITGILLYGQPLTTFFALLCSLFQQRWLTNAFLAMVCSLIMAAAPVLYYSYIKQRTEEEAAKFSRQIVRFLIPAFVAIALVLYAGRQYHYKPDTKQTTVSADSLTSVPTPQEAADLKKWNEITGKP